MGSSKGSRHHLAFDALKHHSCRQCVVLSAVQSCQQSRANRHDSGWWHYMRTFWVEGQSYLLGPGRSRTVVSLCFGIRCFEASHRPSRLVLHCSFFVWGGLPCTVFVVVHFCGQGSRAFLYDFALFARSSNRLAFDVL